MPVSVNGNHKWPPASTTHAAEAASVSTDARLLGHAFVTVLLVATAVAVAWQVLFTGPGMGVNRYVPGRVSTTGAGGPAVQTGPLPAARVEDIQRDPLPSGVPPAQQHRNIAVPVGESRSRADRAVRA